MDKGVLRITADFSIGTTGAKTQWDDIFDVLKEKGCQLKNSMTDKKTKQNYKTKGEIKTCQDKHNLRQFITRRPALWEKL